MSNKETKITKDADLKITLVADSGYIAAEKHRVSADQWARILAIIKETS